MAHVTYRATVTVTLDIGPHECKSRQTLSIWSRYDISYYNLLSRKVSMQILWYFRYRSRTLHVGPLSQPHYIYGHMSSKTGKQCQFGQDMTYRTTICCPEKFPCKFCGILGIGHARYM